MGKTFVGKDCANVCKVEVDKFGICDNVAYALNALTKHVVRDFERAFEGNVLVKHFDEFLVGDNQKRIDEVFEVFDAFFGVFHTLRTLEVERFGDNRDGENVH